MKKLIFENESEKYYIEDEPLDPLAPPNSAASRYRFVKVDGEKEEMAIPNYVAIRWDVYPNPVVQEARRMVEEMPGDTEDEEWLRKVYSYYAHQYKFMDAGKVLRFGKHLGNERLERIQRPNHHLGVRHVWKYNPSHHPRLDLILDEDKMDWDELIQAIDATGVLMGDGVWMAKIRGVMREVAFYYYPHNSGIPSQTEVPEYADYAIVTFETGVVKVFKEER